MKASTKNYSLIDRTDEKNFEQKHKGKIFSDLWQIYGRHDIKYQIFVFKVCRIRY